MKHFNYLLLMVFACFSCISNTKTKTEQIDNLKVETAVALDFPISGSIKECALYVYLNGTLVTKTTGITSASEPISITVPFFENMKAIVIANGANSTTGIDSLPLLKVGIGSNGENQIFISEIANFKSDTAGKTIALSLQPMVGKLSFAPRESEQDIAYITQFDMVRVTYKNVPAFYYPSNKSIERTDLIFETDKTKGFATSIYTFAGTGVKLNLKYFLANVEKNSTPSDIPAAGVEVKKSVESQVKMYLFEKYFLDHEFATRGSNMTVRPTSEPIVGYYPF